MLQKWWRMKPGGEGGMEGSDRGGFPFPRGLESGGCGGRQDLCYVNKAGHASCRGASAIDALSRIAETKHGSWRRRRKRRRTREKQGGWSVCVYVCARSCAGGVQGRSQRKSPFPLSCASASCLWRKSLVGVHADLILWWTLL